MILKKIYGPWKNVKIQIQAQVANILGVIN